MRHLNIPDPKEFLANVASIYPSMSRILMEYPDNSLDDAEDLRKENKGEYPYPIEIIAKIDRRKEKVSFLDNCRGMKREKLVTIVENVGSSSKKQQPWLNGQFGYGVQAFRASNKNLVITTKTEPGETWRMIVNRDTNEIDDEVKVSDREVSSDTGTLVVLKDFERSYWREIDQEDLASEIETHFDRLLARENLEIKVIDGNIVRLCRPFDMSLVDGEQFFVDIDEIYDSRHKVKTSLSNPIEVRLKVCEKPLPGKQPVFTNNGRRIDEVCQMRSFYNKSKSRGRVWSHPHLIGYIEVNLNLDPDLKRSDFKNSKKRTPIYEEIVAIEEQVQAKLSEIVKSTNAESLSKLGNLLTSLLDKLAKEDRIKMRVTYTETKDPSAEVLVEDPDSLFELVKKKGGGKKGHAKTPAGDVVNVSSGEGELKGKQRRTGGFAVRFDDTELDVLMQEDGSIPRSNITGDTINIYTNHPDFSQRVGHTRHGELQLTQRLASYLSSVMSLHYKNAFYDKYKINPDVKRTLDSRIAMFDDHLSCSCSLEEMLQGYIGKSVDALEEA